MSAWTRTSVAAAMDQAAAVVGRANPGRETMTESRTQAVSREAKIVYITEWAARYGSYLQLSGEVGFGRECVGILKGDTYIDYADCMSIWTPEDAYHKHDCLAVLGRGDEALAQLYQWVKWLDEHGYGVEEVCRQPSGGVDLLLHGISLPRLVKLTSESPHQARTEGRAVMTDPAAEPGPRIVSFDLMPTDPDYYFVLTEALQEFAARQRAEAEDEADPESRIRWAETAEQALERIEEALSNGRH